MLMYETDSRLIKPGQTFVAIEGKTVDGHDYIDEAIKNGASKIVVSKDITTSVPTIKVNDTYSFLINELVNIYSKKFKKMKFIGVTGTNGKTTTCYLTYQMLKKLDTKPVYIGTLGCYLDEEFINLNNTTPDILTLYKLLDSALEKDCTTVIMEVSSHALDQKRIAGLKFDIAAFTNLTQDHLDYHKSLNEYLNAKLKITDYLKNNGLMIINSDDKASIKFKEKFNNTLSIGNNADIKIIDFNIEPNQTKIKFNYLNKTYNVTTNLTSKFNIYNYLFSLTILTNLGYDINQILNITEDIKAPKGRCETYQVKNGYAVIDYAHTPDAVEKVINAYNELKMNNIITILGCGGNRDPLKRPIMGRIATDYSDYVIFTNDNPRNEKQEDIINDILKGVNKDNYKIIYDRKEAIKYAIDIMQYKDILLILGKGHENYQIIGDKKLYIDDSEEVKKYIYL